MLFTDVQRSVRLNKKKKSTNTSPYPDEVIDRLARAFYPAILACWLQPLFITVCQLFLSSGLYLLLF